MKLVIRLGNNEDLKTLTKTFTFVDANANADSNAQSSTMALRECCSGDLKTEGVMVLTSFFSL